MDKVKELEFIWKNFCTDQHKGFDALYNLYHHMIFAYCLGKIKNQESAENAVADVFMRILRYKNPSEIHNPENWMFTIARNICLNYLNKKNRRQKIMNEISWKYDYTSNDHADQQMDMEYLTTIIKDNLSEYDYEIWALHKDGHDNAEIAQILEKSEKTVANRKVNIRNRIKEIVKTHFDRT